MDWSEETSGSDETDGELEEAQDMKKERDEQNTQKAKEDNQKVKKEADSKKDYVLIESDSDGKPIREIDMRQYTVFIWKTKNSELEEVKIRGEADIQKVT